MNKYRIKYMTDGGLQRFWIDEKFKTREGSYDWRDGRIDYYFRKNQYSNYTPIEEWMAKLPFDKKWAIAARLSPEAWIEVTDDG